MSGPVPEDSLPDSYSDGTSIRGLVKSVIKSVLPVGKLIKLVENPRRFVLGVVFSSIAGAFLTTLSLGLNLGKWLAGFPIPGTITVDGSSVNVPWCSKETCDLLSFVDIPGRVAESVSGALTPAGTQFLQALGSIWTSLPSDGGFAGPVILFVIVLLAVVATVRGGRIVIALLPISKP